MRANRLVIPVFAAVALSSCTDAAPTPVVEGSVRELSAFMVGSRIQPSSAERAAVDSLVQLFPSPSAAQIRAILSDPRAKLDLTGNAEVRRRLDAVYEARAARAREISGGVEDATLALVTVLPDAAADAVILRRADAIPHDVILFRADQLSAARLASAIDALYRARRHGGDVPARSMRITVRGAHIPKQWRRAIHDRGAADLLALRRAPMTDLQGIGLVRALSIPLSAASGDAAR